MDLVDVDDDDRPEAGLPPLDVSDGEGAEVEAVPAGLGLPALVSDPAIPGVQSNTLKNTTKNCTKVQLKWRYV